MLLEGSMSFNDILQAVHVCYSTYIYIHVHIFNSLPEEIIRHKGSPESFKKILDEYLTGLPDQPEVGGLIPGARTLSGIPSNSILDWPRYIGR